MIGRGFDSRTSITFDFTNMKCVHVEAKLDALDLGRVLKNKTDRINLILDSDDLTVSWLCEAFHYCHVPDVVSNDDKLEAKLDVKLDARLDARLDAKLDATLDAMLADKLASRDTETRWHPRMHYDE